MVEKFILAVDQGTTSSRAIIFDKKGKIKSVAQKEFTQFYPNPGWVEHDANEIWSSQAGVITEAITKAGLNAESIAAIGITNQRETTVIWDRDTGNPIHNAIVWQDRRTSEFCSALKEKGFESIIKEKTGLLLDAYFSGTKIKWILDNVDGARKKAEEGKLAFGTIDSWLVWKLTDGEKHITDVTNASRTLLFNIHKKEWDDEILKLLDIPKSLLPEVRSSSEIYAEISASLFNVPIPIAGIAGDQQSALFGQMCTNPGMLKNTYGTGGFLVFNTGDKPIASKNNLLTTIAWEVDGKITYALEGSIFIAGAVVQWLRDGLGIIKSSEEVEELANSVDDNGGVYLVPAFAGLGAPHWDQFARGSISGLTRGTTSGHIARAALEAIAFQTVDVLKAMESDSGIKVTELRVDGGATANNLLMQFQSDLLGIPIVRPKISETTALGVAYLAGLAVGYWDGYNDISDQWEIDKKFEPQMSSTQTEGLLNNWNKAVGRSNNWLK
ncbi:MAG: glycerol kinase GlpK [Bacteroidota bacterium]